MVQRGRRRRLQRHAAALAFRARGVRGPRGANSEEARSVPQRVRREDTARALWPRASPKPLRKRTAAREQGKLSRPFTQCVNPSWYSSLLADLLDKETPNGRK